MGSIRSPLWRHGGTVHGPVPRSYAYKLPRKMALGALRSALSAKLRDGELKVVHAFDMNDHKTKSLVQALRVLEAQNKVLLVDVLPNVAPGELTGAERNLTLASRNLEGVKLVPTREVTVYDLLAHKQVLISEAAARKLSEALAV
jgi:large subunit ribosomal protein L4